MLHFLSGKRAHVPQYLVILNLNGRNLCFQVTGQAVLIDITKSLEISQNLQKYSSMLAFLPNIPFSQREKGTSAIYVVNLNLNGSNMSLKMAGQVILPNIMKSPRMSQNLQKSHGTMDLFQGHKDKGNTKRIGGLGRNVTNLLPLGAVIIYGGRSQWKGKGHKI